MKDFIRYHTGKLWIEQVPVASIIQETGTPAYVFSSQDMTMRYHHLAESLPDVGICYGMKSCDTLAIVQFFVRLGAGVDVVSGGEIERVMLAGGDPSKIVFSGVGKTDEELVQALKCGVGQINAESRQEVAQISRLAQSIEIRAPLVLRINPDVRAGGNEKIQTGHSQAKFGMAPSDILALYGQDIPFIDWRGLAVHIGSQISDVAPYDRAFAVVADLVEKLNHPVTHLDLGGGFAVAYQADDPLLDFAAYQQVMTKHFAGLNVRLLIEPGRYLTAKAGILVASVIHDKRTGNSRHVVIDAAMNDLLRPSLYDAFHDIVPIVQTQGQATSLANIVGPICETGDTFIQDHPLPDMAYGDLVAICDTGAYGAVMASNYNSRRRAPQVLVNGTDWRIIRSRETFEDMVRGEQAGLID